MLSLLLGETESTRIKVLSTDYGCTRDVFTGALNAMQHKYLQ